MKDNTLKTQQTTNAERCFNQLDTIVTQPNEGGAYYDDGQITIYNADCLELLGNGKGIKADVTITDPPYMFAMGSASAGGGKMKFNDMLNQALFFRVVVEKCFKAMPHDSAMWMFTNWRSIPVILKAATDINRSIESMLVWDKEWIGPGGTVGLRPSYELVALMASGKWTIPNRGRADIQRFKWSSYKPHGHPAEKPLALMQWLIRESPGAVVLDPFMGSGTTLEAAKREGRKAVGIEIDERYCEIAANRVRQTDMFGGLAV